jgi:type VI secretion system protein ImpE
MKCAEDLLKEGQLGEAIKAATGNVRAKPTGLSARVFLFELLSFAGNLERAGKQLDAIAHQSPEMRTGASIYKQLLTAEKARRVVFGGGEPDFLIAPPQYTACYIEALKYRQKGDAALARASLEEGITLRPAVSGVADGKEFSDIEDADIFLAPFLELYLGEKYIWLPFEQIRAIEFQKPLNLRDLLWLRAKLETSGGEVGEVFIPVIYPGTSDEGNDLLSLGRQTHWIDVGQGLSRGVGQRMFLINGIDHAMLQTNKLSVRSI